MTLLHKKHLLSAALVITSVFFTYKTIFKYGCDALSNSFICQLTILFAILVYSSVKPTRKFLASYLPLTFLYLLIPALGLLCGHKIPAHEYLASFMVGNFFYFSVLYLKLAPEKALTHHRVRLVISYICDVLYFAALLYALSFYLYFVANGGILQGDIILAIAQTNPREALTYLETSFSGTQLAVFSVALLAILTGGWFITRVFHRTYSKTDSNMNNQTSQQIITGRIFRTVSSLFIIFFMGVMSLGILVQSGKGYGCQAKQVLAFSCYMLRSYGDFVKNRDIALKNIQFSGAVSSGDQEKGVYVLIIGESATRNHLSLYGYKHDTTPRMRERISENKDNFRFISFRNAYSSFTHTVQSVTNALTNVNQYNGEDLSHAVSIIDIAGKAGFDTYWLSNQSGDSMIVTPLTAISMSADNIKFVSESHKGGKIFDLDILDIVPKKFNAEKDSLVIIHLMGSHTKYLDRFPEDFSRFFDEEDIINEYDNSIYYTDYVVDRFFQHFSANTNLKFFGYFSDHGADPRQMGNDHNTTHFVFDMVRIPFIVGFSEKYLQQNDTIVSTLSQRIDTCFTNDLIFDLMLSVMGLTSSNYYNSSYDLSSNSYSINMENARTLLGEKKISEDPDYGLNTK